MPCTIIYPNGPSAVLLDDDYQVISNAINQVTNEPSPVIHASYQGDPITLSVSNVLVVPGDKTELLG